MEENISEIPQTTTEISLNEISDKKLGETFEKQNMDGQVVTITDVKLERSSEVLKTQNDKPYHPVMFKVFYGDGVYENYGGVKSYIINEGKTIMPPTIWTQGDSASAVLFRNWLSAVGKKEEDVSMKDFFNGLTGKTAKLKATIEKFRGKEYQKNVIAEFLKEGAQASPSSINGVPVENV